MNFEKEKLRDIGYRNNFHSILNDIKEVQKRDSIMRENDSFNQKDLLK